MTLATRNQHLNKYGQGERNMKQINDAQRNDDTLFAEGVFLINRHNGILGMISNRRITDFGDISWGLRCPCRGYTVSFSTRQIVENWYILRENEYSTLMNLTKDLVDAGLAETAGQVPMWRCKTRVHPIDNSLDTRVSLSYSWIDGAKRNRKYELLTVSVGEEE